MNLLKPTLRVELRPGAPANPTLDETQPGTTTDN
jgi:hypothetical protein